MKKKILLLFITLAILFTSLTSCRKYYTGWQKVTHTYQTDIINALNSEDINELTKLFAPSVSSSNDFEAKAATLLSMLPPEVICLTDASTGAARGVPHEESDKSFKYTQTTFKVSTTGKEYDIAILVCYEHPLDSNEIGILSLFITDNHSGEDDYRIGGLTGWDWPRGIIFDL